MGVPKFFRYIAERYPCLLELVREQSMPDFDNLYLDMNGIVHNCSHPDDTNIFVSLTEEEMFRDIFNYIDKLFFLIKPKKVFFMAIDGVAPRAKMNQQRSRRFQTARTAEKQEAEATERGFVRETERFDSNCITPGTVFMERLNAALQYFVKSKMSSDPLWQKVKVILSGPDCPGEGEHKIMNYIRYLKSQKDFDPNTKHCLYGLDADLIILGLCTHELHFVVLREEVKFNSKNQKRKSVEQTRFFLLHLGLFREYLNLEFDELKQHDPNFDVAQLIDDWVLMGFMVGNDFIPHLPCLHISSNALPLLYKTYIKVYPELGGNLNEQGKLNLERLEKFFAALAIVEYEKFQEDHENLKGFEGKAGKNGIEEAFDFDVNEINNDNLDDELEAMIQSSKQFMEDDAYDSGDDESRLRDEFELYKRNYYISKLKHDEMSNETKHEQAICYITALQWILDYYYNGVQSWNWYYPHHYAPFISDLKDFKHHKITYEMGQPFLPFQQLLAVLPAASRALLPAAYRELMTDPDSELIDFYPTDFQTDLNGKLHEWEAVVLIPFIDEKRLLNAMKLCEGKLTENERRRNQHGPMLEYKYSKESQGSLPGIYSFKNIYHVYCTETPISNKELDLQTKKTVCVEHPDAARTVFFPGFPTMKHLKFDFEVKHARVKVFDYPSRNASVILQPHDRPKHNDLIAVAEKYLNQVVYIGWPHLIKAKVVAVSDKDKYVSLETMRENVARTFKLQVESVKDHFSNRMGIEFNDLNVLVHVNLFIGSHHTIGSKGKLISNEIWSNLLTNYPAQGIVSEIQVHDPDSNLQAKVEHFLPKGSEVFFLGKPYFGSKGVILDPMMFYECGRLLVNITALAQPDFTRARQTHTEKQQEYADGYYVSSLLGIPHSALSRITGSVLIIPGARRKDLPENVSKQNIGLQFKMTKTREERSGFMKFNGNNNWLFSPRGIELIQSYCSKYPSVIGYLSSSSDLSNIFEQDLFPDQVGEKKIEEIIAWIATLEHTKSEFVPYGSKTVEKDAIYEVIEAIEHLKSLPVKNVKLQVKPHLLLKPDITLPSLYKSKCKIKLFDRVVIVKNTYMVPLGATGTVIGIHPVSDPNPVRIECVNAVENFYEILFDKTIPNGNDIYGLADNRVYKVPESSVLLIYIQENYNKEFWPQNAETSPYSVENSSQNAPNIGKPNTSVNNSIKDKSITIYYHQEAPSTSRNAARNNQKEFNDKKQPANNAAGMNKPVEAAGGGSLAVGGTKTTVPNKKPEEDKSNFWAPSTVPKIVKTNMPLQTPPCDPAVMSFTPPKILSRDAQPAATSAVDQTSFLKSLLGINLNSDAAATSASSAAPQQPIPPITEQKINLPQPPLNWREQQKQYQKQQQKQQQPNLQASLQPQWKKQQSQENHNRQIFSNPPPLLQQSQLHHQNQMQQQFFQHFQQQQQQQQQQQSFFWQQPPQPQYQERQKDNSKTQISCDTNVSLPNNGNQLDSSKMNVKNDEQQSANKNRRRTPRVPKLGAKFNAPPQITPTK